MFTKKALVSLLKSALAVAAVAVSIQAAAEVVFYEREGFQGRSFTADRPVGNFERAGFNDRASSAVVFNERWEVCEDIRFSGRCAVLRPGRYPSLAAMGMNNSITSVRPVTRDARVRDDRYAPPAAPVYDNRRRNNERLYEAQVTSVRAVVGPPQQRCWVEQEQVGQDRNLNVPGAVIGAVIGGVLGHQVGSGRGNTAATVGGAVAGGAVGSQVGRGGGVQTRDVQRCETVSSQQRPEFYDVTYNFRGQEHRIQTTNPPGPTVTVNERGEPRA
jgi:uncharacterized protein YcfJ